MALILTYSIVLSADINFIHPIATPEEAVKRALIYLELDKLDGYSPQPPDSIAWKVVYNDSTIPFLGDSVNGKTTWLVRIENIKIDAPELSESLRRGAKYFDVYIDVETGRLIKFIGRLHGRRPDETREPSAKVAESQMRDTYWGFPAQPPEAGFYDILALSNIVRCVANGASDIIGYYVLHSGMPSSIEMAPRWSIIYKGLSPMPTPYDIGSSLSYDQLTTERDVYNANTGGAIVSVSVPFIPGVPHPKGE